MAAKEVLEKINLAIGTKFRPVVANLRFIQARLDEGATVEEIVGVAKLKKSEWKDDPVMRKYIRIETLYNATKFQSYLAELDEAKERASIYDELR